MSNITREFIALLYARNTDVYVDGQYQYDCDLGFVQVGFLPIDLDVQLQKVIEAHTWPIEDSNICTKCGCNAVATIEYVRGTTGLNIEGNKGDWEYATTQFDYEDSRTTVDIHGNVVLICANCRHEWAHPNLKTEAGVGNVR